jgi:hypothetical protein
MEKVTTIKDLIARLQECDPEGSVTISLDGALLYDDGEQGEIEYGFEPMIDCLFSRADTERSDHVYFVLSEESTARIVSRRREECVDDFSRARPHLPSCSGVVIDAPVAIAVGLTREIYTNLQTVVESCNRAHQNNNGATTHGGLDVPKLLALLAEDAAMTNQRPGSWEGANLQQVLDGHGYRACQNF